MDKIKAYGFEVTNNKGHGFKRWFNGAEQFTDEKLPFGMNRVYVTQKFMEFKPAVWGTRILAKEHGLNFKTLTEQDWNNTGHPVKRLFKKIFRRKK